MLEMRVCLLLLSSCLGKGECQLFYINSKREKEGSQCAGTPRIRACDRQCNCAWLFCRGGKSKVGLAIVAHDCDLGLAVPCNAPRALRPPYDPDCRDSQQLKERTWRDRRLTSGLRDGSLVCSPCEQRLYPPRGRCLAVPGDL